MKIRKIKYHHPLPVKIISETLQSLSPTDSESVANVGYALGYNDASNFSTFFKHHASVSPGAFRKKML